MSTPEEKRAEAAQKKREYRQRKKQEELARQAPNSVLEEIANEQGRQAPQSEIADLFNRQGRNLSNEELQERDRRAEMQEQRRLIALKFNQAFTPEQQKTAIAAILANNPELEKIWNSASKNSKIVPYHRDEQLSKLADQEERLKRTELAVEPFKKYASNPTNILLLEILRTLTLTRLELTDLIGGLK